MRRAPLVIVGTVAGLVGVLEFHTSPASLTSSTGAALPAASTTPAASSSPPSGSASTASPAATPSASSSSSTSVTDRTAVGPAVNYTYGVLSVRVTVSGNKIINVGIASLNDGASARSQAIDDQAIPVLEQEALQAQSANIQGVSGASFTSAGFTQSLQGALRSLGVA